MKRNDARNGGTPPAQPDLDGIILAGDVESGCGPTSQEHTQQPAAPLTSAIVTDSGLTTAVSHEPGLDTPSLAELCQAQPTPAPTSPQEPEYFFDVSATEYL